MSRIPAFLSFAIAVGSANMFAHAEERELILSSANQETVITIKQDHSELMAELKALRTRLERIEKLLERQTQSTTASPAVTPEPSPPVKQHSLTVEGIKIHHDTPVDRLTEGKSVSLGNGDHRFIEVPEIVNGRNYTPRNGYQGNLRLDMLKPQKVYVAFYGKEWGQGGNASGNWKPELVSKEQLEKNDWKNVGTLEVKHSNPNFAEEPPWLLYSRDCKAGESFLLRSHKYQAPILIWGKIAE